MNPLLLNREFKLPADGWIHIVPIGEFAHSSGVVQVVDRAAVDAMANKFNADKAQPNFPGVLIDYDHFSDDPDKPSAAAGWIDEVQSRADGLYAKPRWTANGKTAVEGGDYRLVSPVFDRASATPLANREKLKRLRPMRLLKVALTNDPNLKGMVPLSNRAGTDAAADSPNQTDRTPKMKALATKLGLSAEASEDAVIAEVSKLLNRAEAAEKTIQPLTAERDALKNRVAQIDGEQLDADLEAAGIKASDPRHAKVKPVLSAMSNRVDRLSFLKECIGTKADKVQGTLHNRSGAATPTPESGGNAADEQAQFNEARKVAGEIESYKLANRCTYSEARNAVRLMKPELFGLTGARN